MLAGDHHSRERTTPSPRKSSRAALPSPPAWSVLESRLFRKVFAFGALRVQQLYFTYRAHLEVCKAQSESDRKLPEHSIRVSGSRGEGGLPLHCALSLPLPPESPASLPFPGPTGGQVTRGTRQGQAVCSGPTEWRKCTSICQWGGGDQVWPDCVLSPPQVTSVLWTHWSCHLLPAPESITLQCSRTCPSLKAALLLLWICATSSA